MEEINKKELIRRAAVDVISREGFYNTKMASIAEEAGIAVGTIYNYFKNKEDILDYIFKYELEKRLRYLKTVNKKELSFWEKLSSFMDFHFKEVKENINVGKILVREKEFPKKEGSDSINEYLNMIPKILNKMIEGAIKKGEINEEHDPEITGNLIFGAIQGIVERAIHTENKEMLIRADQELLKTLRNGLE